MTPAAIIKEAMADGVSLALSTTGTIKAGGKQDAVNRWLPVIRENKPAILAVLASQAEAEDLRPSLPGVSTEFAARLSAEDLGDIATGDIPLATVQAFEQAAIARETEDLREAFEERAGILEHDAAMPRPEAELEAARITATYARNQGYLWASLRSALAEYPALLTFLPDTPGTVDTLLLGVAKVAVLKGGRVVRQGAFAGQHEVKP